MSDALLTRSRERAVTPNTPTTSVRVDPDAIGVDVEDATTSTPFGAPAATDTEAGAWGTSDLLLPTNNLSLPSLRPVNIIP
ncbi:hypothetical protein NEUTE1DRAFT_137088 [Neurospora tetrasperma FGSC 2508]|uniref:Uncharacterized protein n=1 Tax=Neurospora tetrasperma (strain FGSC 2508 / ATCC MYA-4615 / P0657) TaxID=510951 RepID=F8MN64_NEUT8|nr:uncharacterized protein NEUTE1DRAFT_137088 [Neurospora tetrasperma FGSC 2508]EGO57237.1 hypothetical protein NEUTE1DRAFT_137088 [Neurospora tetrasperma FGSC 2508]